MPGKVQPGRLLHAADVPGAIMMISDDDTEILDKSCLGLQNKITSLKSSLVWHFFTGDKRKKLGVILQLEQQYDVKIDQIEVLK